MIEAKVKWAGGLKFEGTSAFGHPIATDGSKKAGGNEDGYKPTELVLFGLAGCTGIDVVRILEKMRQELNDLEIEIQGSQPEEYPKPFNRITVKYTFTGKNLDRKKVEKAIELSEGKYCMIAQSLQGVARFDYKIELKEG